MAVRETKGLPLIGNRLQSMKLIDLQRECLMRGLAPEELVKKSVPSLQTWITENWWKDPDKALLTAFDKWREDYLIAIGKAGEPFVRLGYLGETDPDTGEVIKILKPKRAKKSTGIKRERNEELGIFTGTKKALTFQCVVDGMSVDDAMKKVMEVFPEAKDKSIKIWYKRAQKKLSEKA